MGSMAKNKLPPKPGVKPDVQISAMKSLFPNFKATKKGCNVIFIGELIVKDGFRPYKVRVDYRGNHNPMVYVLSPELEDDSPHVYPKERNLCLYHPDNYKWNKDKLIAKDIIPWTCAWIYFYEYWLRTGEWIGPEAHHSSPKHNTES